MAQAVTEHLAHAMRRGRHKLVLFEDVDVGYLVRRRSENPNPTLDRLAEVRPQPHRAAVPPVLSRK